MRCETLQAISKGKCYIGIAEVGADGTFIKVNERYADMLGYSVFEMEGRMTFQDVTHAADVATDVEQTRMVRDGHIEHYPMTKRYWTKTEDLLWVEIFVKGVFINGVFSHFAVQCRPVMKVQLPSKENGRSSTAGFQPFRWLKNNWQVVTAGITAIGLIIAEVIRQVGHNGGPNG